MGYHHPLRRAVAIPSDVSTTIGQAATPHFISNVEWHQRGRNSTGSPIGNALWIHTLKRVIEHVLLVDPRLGLVYFSKVDLVDAYIRLWVHAKEMPLTSFIIHKNKEGDE